MDLLEVTSALMRCPSVTPVDAGALGVLEGYLKKLGFSCTVLRFSGDGSEEVANLYARLGAESPNLCYAGHTDVVPAGDPKDWQYPPFDAIVRNGVLHGRGAVDMKGAIGAFVVAVERYLRMLKSEGTTNPGSISLLITGDEEGVGINGTRKVLEWLKEKGEVLDHCLVGEPTNPGKVGDMVKIGRRGSLNAVIRLIGKQGHVAYPEKALNPLSRLVALLEKLTEHKLDEGAPNFEPSNLEITSIDVGNMATNVIPGEVLIRLNIRFNDNHTGDELAAWLTEVCQNYAGNYKLSFDVSGEAFVTVAEDYAELVKQSIKEVTGNSPVLSTSGGTSDARFIKDVCPVVEFGLISQTMHQTDECVAVRELECLSDVYAAILRNYFSAGRGAK